MDVVVDALRFERDGRRVVEVPQLTFASGTTTALFGPNGSGKTTLLRLIAALERPTTGAVRLGGVDVTPHPRSRQRVGFAFQDAVFLHGTVRDNLELGLVLRRVPLPEREVRIREVARECGVAHLIGRPARKLSGGEAQRVNLARALALRAPVTLLDEPLAGLDRVGRAQLLDDLPRLLATFATTTIIVTHDREEAFRIAEDLVVLVDGVVHAAGPKQDVYQKPPDQQTAELVGYTVIPLNGTLRAIPPGALRFGRGPGSFDVVVERIVDMGNHRHLLGHVADAHARVRVDVRLPPGFEAPAVGSRVGVQPESSVLLVSRPASAEG